MGTQAAPDGSTSDYTINGVSHADGSSSFSRVDKNSTTGDKETTFGGTDAEGDSSYSSSIEHADGSVTIVTRSVDKNGDGTEHVTDVDAQGNTTRDETVDVKGGTTGSPGGVSGSSGGSSGDNSGSGGAGGDGTTGSGGTSGSGTSGSEGSGSDPNNPSQPDSPDSPDSGGSGSGMESDYGTDDRAPAVPWGKIGHKSGDPLDGLFSGIREGDSGGNGDEEGRAVERNDQWIQQLMREIHDAGTGGGSVSGGADETGWGSGEGPRGIPLVSSALTPLVATFAKAAAGLAGSGNQIGALRS